MALTLEPKPTPEEQTIRDKTSEFVRDFVHPTSTEDDDRGHFDRSQFDRCASLGLASLLTSKEYGGGAHSTPSYLACIEELARGSLAIAVTVSVNNLPQGALSKFGTDAQKETFLRPLAEGKWLGAFALSEPQSGSDAAGLRCQATRVDGGYRLNGTKCWISSAGEADVYLVMTRTSPERTKGITSFLVEKGRPGFSFGKKEDKLGMRGSPLGELVFEDCYLPEQNRLGIEGQGLEVALSQLDAGRLAIGATGLGLAIEALHTVLLYRREKRKQSPNWTDGMNDSLAELYARLQSVKLLQAEAAKMRDRGERITLIAAQLKLLASDLAMETTSQCLQSLQYDGLNKTFKIERMFRDAKSLQIVEGTNQIQKLVIHREMENQYEV